MLDAASEHEIQEKIKEYTEFIDQKLRPDLTYVTSLKRETEDEINEYKDLRSKLQDMCSHEKENDADQLVDLGYGTIFCRAKITNPKEVFVHVGFGFHIQFTLSEAVSFIEKRLTFLEEQVLKRREEKCASIASHLNDALLLMRELKQELDT